MNMKYILHEYQEYEFCNRNEFTNSNPNEWADTHLYWGIGGGGL